MDVARSTKADLTGWIIGVLSTLIGASWAVLTYVVPDPSVLGIPAINWRNILLFLAFLLCLCWLAAFFWSFSKPRIGKATTFVVYFLTSFGFFWIGQQYENPSFGIPKRGPIYKENASTTLGGVRVERIGDIAISLAGCEKALGQIACRVEMKNAADDRVVGFHRDTRVFDNRSNELRLTGLRIGSSMQDVWRDFTLPKGVTTSVLLIFKTADDDATELSSLRIRLERVGEKVSGVKFTQIVL